MSSRRPSPPRAAALCVALLTVSLPACSDEPGSTEADTDAVGTAGSAGSDGADGSSSGEPSPIDEAEVLERAAQYATELVQINDQPFASQHGLASTVNVFVDPAAADLYGMLDPAAPAELDFPEGTLLVKEHLDDAGDPSGYTLMVRGPEGYAPEASDWYWARVDGSGMVAESGAVDFCIACHSAAPGHVFGVETDNRR